MLKTPKLRSALLSILLLLSLSIFGDIFDLIVYDDILQIREEYQLNPGFLGLFDEEGLTPLSNSITYGTYEMTEELIKLGIDINTPNKIDKETPIMVALYYEDYELVDLLINSGADLNYENDNKDTLGSFFNGYVEEIPLLKKLMYSGLKINTIPIEILIESEVEFIKEVLSHDYVVTNLTDIKTITEIAFDYEDLTLLDLLLKNNTNINDINSDFWGSIFNGWSEENPFLLKLIKYGLDTNKIPFNVIEDAEIEFLSVLLNNDYRLENDNAFNVIRTVIEYSDYPLLDLILKTGDSINLESDEGFPLLYYSMDEQDIDMIKYLLNSGADINWKDGNGKSLLSYAMSNYYDIEIIILLLENGIDINTDEKEKLLQDALLMGYDDITILLIDYDNINLNMLDDYGRTLLEIAIKNKNMKLLKKLIKNNININIQNEFGNTALHIAIKKKNLIMVKELLSSGADIDNSTMVSAFRTKDIMIIEELFKYQDKETNRGLIFDAIFYGDYEVVSTLIKYVDDLDIMNDKKETPLLYAFEYNRPEIFKLLLSNITTLDDNILFSILTKSVQKNNKEYIKTLIENNIDINNLNNEQPPLYLAFEYDNLDFFEYLLSIGADPNLPSDYFGIPLISWVVMKSKIEFIQLLLKYNTDVMRKDTKGYNIGYTPIIYSMIQDNQKITELLLNNGANINQYIPKNFSSTKMTILMYSIKYNKTNSSVLLNRDLNLELKDNEGRTALFYAIEDNKLDLVDSLLKKGANPNSLDNNNNSPLILATYKTSLPIIKKLLSYNANINHYNDMGDFPLFIALNRYNDDKNTTNFNVGDFLFKSGALAYDFRTPIFKISTKGHSQPIIDIDLGYKDQELYTLGEDKIIYKWDKNQSIPEMAYYPSVFSTGKVNSFEVDSSGKLMYVSCSSSSQNDEGLYTLGTIRVLSTINGNILSETFETEESFVTYLEDINMLISKSMSGNTINIYKIKEDNGKILTEYSSNNAEYGVGEIFISVEYNSLDKTLHCLTFNGTLKIYDIFSKTMLSEKKFIIPGNIVNMKISPSGNSLITIDKRNSINLYNYPELSHTKELKTNSPNTITDIKYINDSSIIYGEVLSEILENRIVSPITILSFDGSKKEYFEHNATVNNIVISKSGKEVVSSGGREHQTHIWDLSTTKTLKSFKGIGKTVFNLAWTKTGFAFGNTVNDGLLLESVNYEKESTSNIAIPFEKEFNLKTKSLSNFNGKILSKDINEKNNQQLSFISEEFTNYISIGTTKIQLPNFNETLIEYSFTPDGKYIILGSSHGLYRIAINNPTTLEILNNNTVLTMSISPDSKTLITSGTDQIIKVWDIKTKKLLFSIFISDSNEWVAWTPKGFYESSLNGDKLAGWLSVYNRYSKNLFFLLSQYSSVFYKPGIIDSKLNREDTDFETQISFDNYPPNIKSFKINQKDVSFNTNYIKTDKNIIDINLESYGANKMDDVEVFINGRPFNLRNHSKGIPSKTIDDEKLSASFTFHLTKELTNIRIFTRDKLGFSSREKLLTINYTGKDAIPNYYESTEKVTLDKPKGTLHVIAIGTNIYSNEGMKELGLKDLSYAEKDAKDIVELFKDQEGRFYNSVSVTNIEPEEVNDLIYLIEDIKFEMEPGDSILLFLSGHGLQKADDYYVLTKDSDPRTKESLMESAISWNILGETLKKLVSAKEIVVLIDACQSGGVKALELGKKWSDMGVILITSSMAGQYSYENKMWENGAFTKAIVDGFRKQSKEYSPADKSKDDVLIISEVMTYAVKSVMEMTEGQQTPWMPSYDKSQNGRVLGVSVK